MQLDIAMMSLVEYCFDDTDNDVQQAKELLQQEAEK
jgi:hypothetical protein